MTVFEALEMEGEIWRGYTVALTEEECSKLAVLGDALDAQTGDRDIAEMYAVFLNQCLEKVTHHAD